MKKQLLTVMITGSLLLLLSGCKARTNTSISYYSYETQCLGVELDGSQTLKVWGNGSNRRDAVEQAKKNAVRDVLFKGNFGGSRECQTRPLMLEVNAQEKYERYFNVFFRDGGNYARFVSLKDERLVERIMRNSDTRNRDQSSYTAVVRVLRDELREQLIRDGILR